MKQQVGIYDTIFSTFDLGPGFWNRELRTQDLDGYLANYWIDPKGFLWSIDYSGTYSFEDSKTITVVKNTNHGKISPFYLNKQLELYPAIWKTYYAPTPRAYVKFEDGHVENVIFAS